MTAADVLVKIRTMFERKGATEATDALKQTAATAKQTGKDVEKSGQSGADGLNVMSAATAAMNGNFAGAASALVPLITKIKALGAAMTSVSLVMAALTLVYMAFSKIAEYAAKAAEAVAAFNAKARADMIEAVTNSYNKQAIAMERVSKLRDAELERTLAINEANKEFELASAKQAKLTELKGTTDETKRAEIEAKYARVEQQITGNYSAKNEQAEYNRMKAREVEVWEASEKKAQEIIQKKALLRRTEQSAVDADKAAKDLREEAWGTGNGAALKREEEAKKAREDAEAQRKDIEKLEQDRINLADEAKRIGGLRPSVQRRMAASAMERENATAQLDISDSDRARSEQSARFDAAKSVDEALSHYGEADQKFVAALIQAANLRGDATASVLKETAQWLNDNRTMDRNRQ